MHCSLELDQGNNVDGGGDSGDGGNDGLYQDLINQSMKMVLENIALTGRTVSVEA